MENVGRKRKKSSSALAFIPLPYASPVDRSESSMHRHSDSPALGVRSSPLDRSSTKVEGVD